MENDIKMLHWNFPENIVKLKSDCNRSFDSTFSQEMIDPRSRSLRMIAHNNARSGANEIASWLFAVAEKLYAFMPYEMWFDRTILLLTKLSWYHEYCGNGLKWSFSTLYNTNGKFWIVLDVSRNMDKTTTIWVN